MTFTYVTVTRNYDIPDGTDPAGYLTLVPAVPMINDGVTIAAVPVRANLDVDGLISIDLAACTDPDTEPTTATYLVTEKIVGQVPRQYYVAIPHDVGPTVDLGELDTLDAVPPRAAALAAHVGDDNPHPGLGLTFEQVRDTIGTTLVAGTGITKTVDDPGDTVTIAAPLDAGGHWYVDPAAADDSGAGTSWATAKETIQAAVTAAASGDTIHLALDDHDVTTGVTIPAGKVLSFLGSPLGGRQFGPTGTRIYSSTGSPAWLFDYPVSGTTNVYGGQLQDLIFDVRGATGGGVRARNLNHVRVVNVFGHCHVDDDDGRVLFDVRPGSAPGEDASWWHLDQVQTLTIPIGVFGDPTDGGGNYLTAFGTICHAASGTTGIEVTGAQPTIFGNFEGPDIGVHLIGCRGGFVMPVGESVDTLVKLTDVTNAVVIASSSAGTGSAAVEETGTSSGNTIIGAAQTSGLDRSNASPGSIVLSPKFGGPPPYVAANQLLALYNDHSGQQFGHSVVPSAALANPLLAVPLVVEYWNGSAWVTYGGQNANLLSTPTIDGVTLDATHKRIRIRNTSSGFGQLRGLVNISYAQAAGTATTFTVTTYESDATTVLAAQAITVDSPGNLSRVIGSTPRDGYYVTLEINAGLTGGQTATLTEFELLSPKIGYNQEGRAVMRGVITPESNITGEPGDLYRMFDTTANGGGVYVKGTGFGTTTGWVKLQPVDTELTALASTTSAADKVPYYTGSGTATTTDFTSTARTLLDDTSTSAMRTTLGLAIGTNVQAQDADLETISGLTATTDNFLQSKASAWASRTPTQVAADLKPVMPGKYCKIYASATSQTLTNNSLTRIDFTNTSVNDDAAYYTVDLVTENTILCIPAGLYLCTWFVKFSGGSTGERSCTLYNKTGNVDLADSSQYLGNVTVQPNVGASTTVRLAANQEIGVRAWVDGGTNAAVVASTTYHTFLAVTYLGT